MSRILLVEDNAELLQVLNLYLLGQSHEVVCASDGNLAAHYYRKGGFDILITDVMMPNKDGLEVILEIREANPSIQIIAMSGGGQGGSTLYLKLADSFGAHATLAKPFSLQELNAVIQRVLVGLNCEKGSSIAS